MGPAGFRLTPLSLTCDAHLPGTPQSEAGSSAAWLKLAAAFSAGPNEGSEAGGGLKAPPPSSLQTKLYLVMKRRSGGFCLTAACGRNINELDQISQIAEGKIQKQNFKEELAL